MTLSTISPNTQEVEAGRSLQLFGKTLSKNIKLKNQNKTVDQAINKVFTMIWKFGAVQQWCLVC